MGKKVEKLEKIALGAAEQSKRNLFPSITLFEKKADLSGSSSASLIGLWWPMKSLPKKERRPL